MRETASIRRLACCFCSAATSPQTGPRPVSSVSFLITHSMSSRNDSSKAFQCSVLLSSRFLRRKKICMLCSSNICIHVGWLLKFTHWLNIALLYIFNIYLFYLVCILKKKFERILTHWDFVTNLTRDVYLCQNMKTTN